MSNSVVQAVYGTVSSGAATSISAVYAALTNPSLLVAACMSERNPDTFTVTDDGAGGWPIASAYDVEAHAGGGFAGTGSSALYSRWNTSTSSITVTNTPVGGSSVCAIRIFEITGAASSSWLGGTGKSQASDTGAALSIALTIAAANSTVIVFGHGYSAAFASQDTGYTSMGNQATPGNGYNGSEYRADAGAAGAVTLTMNGAVPSQSHDFVAAEYKTSGGGPTLKLFTPSSLNGLGSGGAFFHDRLS